MEIKDFILTPIYLTLIYLGLFILRKRIVKEPELRRYFIPAITLKIIGALAVGIIYQFYYDGGDTYGYFTNGSRHIWEAFLNHPMKGIQLLAESGERYNPNTLEYSQKIDYYGNPPAYLIVKISALFGLFTFHTYAVNAIFFALFSFSGVWVLFITFYRLYPHLHKQFAIACFFIPSLFFWGSGLLKDSVTFGALGWSLFCLYQIFILKKDIIRFGIILLISLYLLKVIKIYILICFIASVLIWIVMNYNTQIKSKTIKGLFKPIFLIISLSLGLLLAYKLSEDNNAYRFDKILETSQATSSWLMAASKMGSEHGSYYDLGEFEMTPLSVLSKLPAAIWVSLFRPYPWESKNIVMFLSSIESLFFFFFTMIAIFRSNILNAISTIRKDPFVLFLLIFSLTFAFAIGFSTWNFGALVRYRIPIIPFYLAAIIIIQDASRRAKIIKRLKAKLAAA